MLSHHHCLYNYYNNILLNSLLILIVVVFMTAFMTTTTCPWLTCKRNIHSIIKSPSCFCANYLAICTSRGKEWTIWGVLHTIHKVGVFLLLKTLLRVFHWHFVDSNDLNIQNISTIWLAENRGVTTRFEDSFYLRYFKTISNSPFSCHSIMVETVLK